MKKSSLFLFFFLSLLGAIGWRLSPRFKSGEIYSFRIKTEGEIPSWMKERISEDLKGIVVTSDAIETSYWEVRKKIGDEKIAHYRILDNKLYKYVPTRKEYKSRDSLLEKALKTLLAKTKVPDLDFLLCPMDGVPESHLPRDFFCTSKPCPILAQAKRREPNSRFIVLIPDQVSLSEKWGAMAEEILALNAEIRWESKEESAFWRGDLTDIQQDTHLSYRFLLSLLSNVFPKEIDAGFTGSHQETKRGALSKNYASKREHLMHKYLPVLDGHMCTYPGYQWRLLSNSVVFKQMSDQIQWFYGALHPYVHFVPINDDMSNLLEKIAEARLQDAEMEEISERAQEFVRKNLMIEENYFFLLQVLKHYALQQRIDFEGLKRETQNDPRWVCIQHRKRHNFIRTCQRIFERWTA